MKDIDKTLIKIAKELYLIDFVAPINDYKEKIKFLEAYHKGEVYNPQYKYKRRKINFDKLNAILDSLVGCNIVYARIINDLKRNLVFINLLKEGITDQVYPYGKPDKKMVRLAKKELSIEKAKKKNRPLKAKEAKKLLAEAFTKYRFDWKVKIKNRMVARADSDQTKKILKIKSQHYAEDEVRKLIVHEIEGHAMRSENGLLQECPIIGMEGMPGYLPAEEGLTEFLEELAGVRTHNAERFSGARIISVDMALTHSFYDIFKVMHEKYNLSVNNAYKSAKRAKRGLEDTSKPGGFIKDHVYYEGYKKMKDFVDNGGDFRMFFAGKIGFDDIYLVESGVLKMPKFLPTWLNAKLRSMKKNE